MSFASSIADCGELTRESALRTYFRVIIVCGPWVIILWLYCHCFIYHSCAGPYGVCWSLILIHQINFIFGRGGGPT